MPGDRQQPFLIPVGAIYKVTDFDCAFTVLYHFAAQLLALSDKCTSGTYLVIRHERSGELTAFATFGNRACGAAVDCVGIVVRDRLSLFAGVEPKDTFCVALQGLISQAHRLVVGSFRIL